MNNKTSVGDARMHKVTVQPLPEWLDHERLLGPAAFAISTIEPGLLRAEGDLSRAEAADLMARLRGLGFGGHVLGVVAQPPLPRVVVRAARTADARRRRASTAGFTEPRARLDAEGRMSLTPEPLAMQLAKAAAGLRVIDAGCGAGGNAIAFARMGCHVTAMDIHPDRLALAQHNARVYGVEKRMRFILGDAITLLGEQTADLLFIDPPWGADWNRKVTRLSDLPLLPPLLAHAHHFAQTWLKLPSSFDTRELTDFVSTAVFGAAEGDARRVKFLWLRRE